MIEMADKISTYATGVIALVALGVSFFYGQQVVAEDIDTWITGTNFALATMLVLNLLCLFRISCINDKLKRIKMNRL